MTRRAHTADDSIDQMTAAFAGTPAGLGMAPALADGPGLEADAGISLQIGRLATALEQQRNSDLARRVERSHAIFPFDFNPVLAQGSAVVVAAPAQFSPNEGYFWDVRKVTAASFTAGSVAMYKNAANDANAEVVFTQAGSYFFGSGQLILNSNDFLVFTGSGITGNITISGRAILVRADYLADYLL
jgi:hypothetical protein